MSDTVISDHIRPTDEIQGPDGEITPNNLLDEVSLYNLYDDRDSPEQDAERILSITYPTQTLTNIIKRTGEKFDESSGVSEGAHVIGGDFGSGKSHIELVLYHLLSSSELGQSWVDDNGIDATLPEDTRTGALQMLNLEREYDRLHVAVGDYLGIDDWEDDELPNVPAIRDALDDRPTGLFIDEFERWFGMKKRSEYTEDNLAFLQNLLEAAGRDDTPLVVYISLLFENPRVEGILPRTNPFRHDLSSRRDEKIRFLLHRLVDRENSNTDRIDRLAKEYTDVYRNNGQIEFDDYHDIENRISRYYPFHPYALDTLMDRFSEQEGHQDARGLLHLLTEILADCFDEVDLILTGDVDVYQYTGWFRFIDEELVSKYLNDYHRLGESTGDGGDDERSFSPHVEELLNIVLLHSLARGGEEGANKRQMLMGTIRKGQNAHEIIQTFSNDVYGHAWHVFKLNGEYAFDTDENPAARIEKKAEDIHKNTAIHRVERLVREDLFDDRTNVYILNPVNTEQQIPDNKGIKFVVSLAAKRSYDDEFEALTTGQEREFGNTLVLVTPKKRSSVDSNTGIIELGRKVIAGEQLEQDEGVLPEGFRDIHDQNYQNLLDRVRDKYGTVHTSTGRGLFSEELSVERGTSTYDAVVDSVRPDISAVKSKVKESVRDAEGGGIQYEHLLNDFYRNTEFPTLTDEQELKDAIDALCRDEVLRVGSYFGRSVGSIGSDTVLVHEEYVQTPDEPEDDETTTITVDPTGDSTSTDDGTGQSTIGTGGGGTGGSSGTQMLACPQCDEPLEETSCECGFEFSASDIEQGTVEIEGADAQELIDHLDELNGEVDIADTGPELVRFPTYGELDAGDKPTLIDRLERELSGRTIHEVNLSYSGTLDADAVTSRGLDGDALGDRVEVEETLTIQPNEPMSTQALLNDVLLRLDTPDDASFEVSVEVEKE